MEFTNCAKCGKIFNRINKPICPDCEKEEEQAFNRLKEYIDENRNKSIIEVSDATGVSVKKILRFVREGRLELSVGMEADRMMTCQKCGKPIKTGVFCDSCIIDYNQTLDVLMAEKTAKPQAGMHSKPSALNDSRNKR